METLAQRAAQDGIRIEPHGVNISSALVDLARQRCPHGAERIWVGNAHDWCPPQRFDVVRTGLEYVPERERPGFLAHLFEFVVAPSGRLVVGMFNEEADQDAAAATSRCLISPCSSVQRSCRPRRFVPHAAP
ncbi:SAM-dependent methyltransferase [Nocardia elegans]|uniref:SAM-dependent methyltransferase n=1 Tax=Nocardia elegans TaxID=300029 RepID=UPI003A5CC3D3